MFAKVADDMVFDAEAEGSLHILRAGPASSTLVLLHGGGDLPPALDQLGESVAGEARILGIDARRRVAGRRTIEGAAADLVEALRPLSGRPLRLAGCEAFGLLAYEVALQLMGADRMVESVDILRDSLTEDEHSSMWPTALLHCYHPQIFPIPLRHLSFRSDTGWREEHDMERLPPTAVSALVQAVMAASRDRRLLAARRPDSLVELKRGARHQPPLFCMPGAGASSLAFIDFASAPQLDRTIYGLEPRGLDGMTVPHVGVEAAAESYVGELLNAAPFGEFHLLGHSWGGLVALEMASRLERSGRPPSSLTVIDAPAIGRGPAADHGEDEVMDKLLHIYAQRAGRSLPLTGKRLAALRGHARLNALRTVLSDAALVPATIPPDVLRGPVNAFSRAVRSEYRPRHSYTGEVDFALATGASSGVGLEERTCSWRRAAGRTIFWEAPGDHMTMLQRPQVGALVDRWVDNARRIEAGRGSRS